LIGTAVIVIVVFTTACILVALFGKNIIVSQIEQNLNVKAGLSAVQLRFPFKISLVKLTVGDLFKAERVSFSSNLLGFFAGKIIIDGLTLVEPEINLRQSSDGVLNMPRFKQTERQPQVYITGLEINKGKFNFIDYKVSSEGFYVNLDDINSSISKVMLPPTSLNAKFKFSCKITGQDNEPLGTIGSEGWIDFGPKNMDASFEVIGLEAAYFSPYYEGFLSKRKVLSAKVNLKSRLKAINNDLNINTDFRLSGLVYAQEEQPEEALISSFELAKDTLDLFTDREGNLNLKFSVKTKLDHPEISADELKKSILKAAARNLADQSPEDLAEKVNSTLQKFKGIGKEMKEIFK
jgi:hypothetical protein